MTSFFEQVNIYPTGQNKTKLFWRSYPAFRSKV